MLVDVHAHLEFKQFDKDRSKLIAKLRSENVGAVINCGVHHEDNLKVLELAKKYDICQAALGLYPGHIVDLDDKTITSTLAFIRSNKELVAISEVGLDYKWHEKESDRQKQRKWFREIISLANDLKKPLIVHSWGAEEAILELLKLAKVPIVLHFFDAPMTIVDKAIKRKYYFTIPTSIGRKKRFKKITKRIPLNLLLTETDAPYQSPDVRKRNDPSNIRQTIMKIAEIRKIAPRDVEDAIWSNYKRLCPKQKYLNQYRKK